MRTTGLRRPEVHAAALAAGTKVGTIRDGRDIGFSSGHKWLWDECPICSVRRWVPLEKRGRWCASCVARKSGRVLRIRECAPKVLERRRYLYALGKAAEAAGLTLEDLARLGGEVVR